MKKLWCVFLILLLLLQIAVPAGATEPIETEPSEPVETTEPMETTEPVETEPTEPIETEPTEPEPEPRPDEAHQPYLSGYSDGSFRPNSTMTRAQLALIVYVLGDYPDAESMFSDVPANKWYTAAVNAVSAAGVFSGFDDGTFRPDSPVSRAQLATVLRHLSGIEAPQGECGFTDVKPGSWYYESVTIAAEQGWASGYPDGSFRPRDNLTRAQAVVMLNRFLDRHPDLEAIEAGIPVRFFPDIIPGKWYYLDVLEAANQHTAHYDPPEAPERWLDTVVASANLADGFYCIGSQLYAAEQGDLIHRAQSGTLAGVRYTCTGDNGVCTVETDVLRLVSGELVLIQNGRPLYAPGKYPDGFYLHQGKLYAAQNGQLIHKSKTDTLQGVVFRCAGESGVCSVEADVLLLVSDELVLIQNGQPLYVPGAYPDGFYARNGQLYAAKNGRLVHKQGSDTLNGVVFSCAGDSGVCTARTEILPLVSGELVMLRGGKLLYKPGSCPEGFYVKAGQLYVGQNGNLRRSAGPGSIDGVTYTCTGESGVCTTTDWTKLKLPGIDLSCFASAMTAETAWSDSRYVTMAETLLAAIHVYERYFQVEYPFTGSDNAAIQQKALEYGILQGSHRAMDQLVLRGDAAVYLSRATRGRELGAINTVTAIPDLPSSSSYYDVVMTLYRAGVMGGVGTERNAKIGSALSASELASILRRLERTENRLHFRLPDKVIETITYGTSGSGRYPLTAYRIGNGKNVMILCFAIHGWEDNWNRDGQSLVYLADQLKVWLENNYSLVQQNNWSVYIMRCLNPDGLYLGNTCNGPGRCTTTYYNSAGTLVSGKGIDMNRCFPYAFQSYTGARNFNGTAPLQCAEARAISSFVSARKGSGFNILVDTHGWYGQIITSSGYGTIYNAFHQQFPNNSYASLRGAHGYFSSWAAFVKGYDACLLELPRGIYSHSAFLNAGCVWRYENAVSYLLQHYNGKTSTRSPLKDSLTSAELDGN